jgi:hypothetical protein
MRITRSCAGTQSSISLTLSPPAAAARANRIAEAEQNVLARQMIGQRLAMGWPIGWLLLDARTALPDAGDIAVEVFQRERQLIGIKALRKSAVADLRIECRSRQQPTSERRPN